MKKFLLILFCNIAVLFIVISICNVLIYKNLPYINMNLKPQTKFEEIKIDGYETEDFTAEIIKSTDEAYIQFCGEERQVFGENYKKRPIVILGCSYAYGHGIKNKETFLYKLSQITKRPIINFALCGDNAIESLKHLKNYINNDKKNKETIKNAEYVIYVYMHDHINRYLSTNFIYENYFLIFPVKNIFLKKIIEIPTVRFLLSSYQIHKNIIGKDKNSNSYNNFLYNSEQYLKKIMLIMQNEIKTYSPNAKIIIILYDQKLAQSYDNLKIKYDTDIQNSKIWDELNNETDMTIVHSKDLTGFLFDKNYKLKADIAPYHPNAKAWEVLTPKFAKKYIK